VWGPGPANVHGQGGVGSYTGGSGVCVAWMAAGDVRGSEVCTVDALWPGARPPPPCDGWIELYSLGRAPCDARRDASSLHGCSCEQKSPLVLPVYSAVLVIIV